LETVPITRTVPYLEADPETDSGTDPETDPKTNPKISPETDPEPNKSRQTEHAAPFEHFW
jgi:hypothetical protein